MGLAVGNINLAQLNQAFKATRQARLNCSYNNSLWPLRPIDECLRKRKVFYAIYVDDLVLLTRTRGQLRKAMKQLYIELDQLKLKLSKPKTFIGKIARGFSFLGYAFGGFNATPHVGVSNIAISRMQDKLNELYEQHASSTRVQTHLAHWWRWVTGGLNRFKDGLLKHLKQFWRPLWLFINSRCREIHLYSAIWV